MHKVCQLGNDWVPEELHCSSGGTKTRMESLGKLAVDAAECGTLRRCIELDGLYQAGASIANNRLQVMVALVAQRALLREFSIAFCRNAMRMYVDGCFR